MAGPGRPALAGPHRRSGPRRGGRWDPALPALHRSIRPGGDPSPRCAVGVQGGEPVGGRGLRGGLPPIGGGPVLALARSRPSVQPPSSGRTRRPCAWPWPTGSPAVQPPVGATVGQMIWAGRADPGRGPLLGGRVAGGRDSRSARLGRRVGSGAEPGLRPRRTEGGFAVPSALRPAAGGDDPGRVLLDAHPGRRVIRRPRVAPAECWPTEEPTASTGWSPPHCGVGLGSGRPTVALVGDLAFLHDASALVRAAGADIPCTIVVADNRGGGIFSFLPSGHRPRHTDVRGAVRHASGQRRRGGRRRFRVSHGRCRRCRVGDGRSRAGGQVGRGLGDQGAPTRAAGERRGPSSGQRFGGGRRRRHDRRLTLSQQGAGRHAAGQQGARSARRPVNRASGRRTGSVGRRCGRRPWTPTPSTPTRSPGRPGCWPRRERRWPARRRRSAVWSRCWRVVPKNWVSTAAAESGWSTTSTELATAGRRPDGGQGEGRRLRAGEGVVALARPNRSPGVRPSSLLKSWTTEVSRALRLRGL